MAFFGVRSNSFKSYFFDARQKIVAIKKIFEILIKV